MVWADKILMHSLKRHTRGFSLVEVIIVVSITALVFTGLFASFQYSLKLINVSRAKLSAISIANDRMEYFRSLPYSDVGVVAGFPSGTIPQNSTTTLNNILFAEKVRVSYVDDPADGAGGADSNAITTDYKQIRLEYSWTMGGVPGSIVMVSNIVPRSIETSVGGGTVRINVLDHASQLLPGASVRVFNPVLGYDVTSVTDVTGAALFSVPAGSGYEVSVTGPIGGHVYSVDGTYVATTSNPTPVVAPFAVLEADISTLTFQIGRVSDLLVRLYSDIEIDSFTESFASLAAAASSTEVVSNGSAVVLRDTAGVYSNSGTVFLGPFNPASLERWEALKVVGVTPAQTTYRTQIFTADGAGGFTLVPDSDMPDNAAGYTMDIIDLTPLDSVAYPELFVGLALSTADTSVTPQVDDVALVYRESETLYSNQSFTMRGTKNIGLSAASEPIYKFSAATTTDGDGESTFTDLEFDVYSISLPTSHDVAYGCAAYPIEQIAGVDGEAEIVFVPNETNTLRLTIEDTTGRPIPGATVSLSRPSYSEVRTTGGCGQVFFVGTATVQVDYELQIVAPGYVTEVLPAVAIDGDVVTTIVLADA